MADLINKNDISFRCSYGGECMAEIEDCKVCADYVCDYEDVQNVAVITEQEIRAKAIDEFAEALRLKCLDGFYKAVSLRDVLKIAEQMKAGDNNE